MMTGFQSAQATVNHIQIHYLRKGTGPPLLLLHGYPQTHIMWHKVVQTLAEHYTVIASDLRGYGDSSTPETDDQHLPYSKRVMADDQLLLMKSLGFDQFYLMAHDRGARVAHRLALDAPEAVVKLILLDIAPTLYMYENTTMAFASAYFHWFLLIQPFNLPEIFIGGNTRYFLQAIFRAKPGHQDIHTDAAVAEYLRCFDESTIHASCEDYRASATIDLQHDQTDRDQKNIIQCPLLIMWGAHGIIGKLYDPVQVWQSYAKDVKGVEVAAGHFIPEECPEALLANVIPFLQDTL